MTDLKNLKQIKSIDLEEFDGTQSKIASVTLLDPQTKDFGEGEVETRQILIETENLSKDSDVKITAREYISLKKDSDGEWGIPTSKNSKATKVLNFFKINSFDELEGKECLVVRKVSGDRTLLGIHVG